MEPSAVRVQRANQPWIDRLRRYKIVLDGVEVGLIRRGETVTLPVQPGDHTIRLKIDWVRSPELEIRVENEEQVKLRCGANARPLTVLYWITAGWRRYLYLELEPLTTQ